MSLTCPVQTKRPQRTVDQDLFLCSRKHFHLRSRTRTMQIPYTTSTTGMSPFPVLENVLGNLRWFEERQSPESQRFRAFCLGAATQISLKGLGKPRAFRRALGTSFIKFRMRPPVRVDCSTQKSFCIFRCRSFSGAATQIRTGDLILTKDALYLLSYSSKVHAPLERGM